MNTESRRVPQSKQNLVLSVKTFVDIISKMDMNHILKVASNSVEEDISKKMDELADILEILQAIK
jgi:hypothetical protein